MNPLDADLPPACGRATGLRGLGLVLAAALLGVGAGPARADSGDFPLNPGNPGEVPTYTIPATTCAGVRPLVNSDFDLVLACSIAGRQANAANSPCDIVDGSTVVGTPIGQCADSFRFPLTPPDPNANLLENDVNLAASAAGLNLALGDRDRISVTAVSGAVGVVRGEVDVRPEPCPGCDSPPSCGGIPVVQSQAACDRISERLGISAASDQPQLSHVLFLDVQKTAVQPNPPTAAGRFLSVAVCSGYRWSCADADATPQALNTSYVGQLPFSVNYTPVCTRTARLTLCCATNAAGVPLAPCPR